MKGRQQSSSGSKGRRARRDPPRHRPGPPADAREAVLRVVGTQATGFPSIKILEPDTSALDPRDSALAHALHESVLRRWLTIRWLLEQRLERPFPELHPALQASLLVGGAQILFMDRIPVHAAIDTSVEWAKRSAGRGGAGLVNAVLRRLSEMLRGGPEGPEKAERYGGGRDEIPLSGGGSLMLAQPILPEDDDFRLAVATGMPKRLCERWALAAGARAARDLALHSLVHPPVVINAVHAEAPIDPEVATPHRSAGHFVFAGERGSLGGLLAGRRDVWVQDSASSAPAMLASHLKPAVIADLCAGQGTKTRQLRRLFPDAKIVASDIDKDRLQTLRGVFEGDGQVEAVSPDELREAWLEKVDLVVLDVPCSNTGVLARRVEAKYRFGPDLLERLGDTQRQLIADSIPLLAPKGRILYATCSLESEENEAMAAWAGKWHGFKVEATECLTPAGLPGEGPEVYRDGSFGVLLGRS
ncbi:MAG: hypothetical protein JJU33_01080 [Phycisphaerales bacterium]|nr:hypothetical protein [Phycisphaerales bacterium]